MKPRYESLSDSTQTRPEQIRHPDLAAPRTPEQPWGAVLLIPGRRLVLGLRWRIGQSEDVIRQPSPEPLVVCELLEELHVVVKHGSHHALQGLVMLDPGVLPVGVLPGVVVGGVPKQLGRSPRSRFACSRLGSTGASWVRSPCG